MVELASRVAIVVVDDAFVFSVDFVFDEGDGGFVGNPYVLRIAGGVGKCNEGNPVVCDVSISHGFKRVDVTVRGSLRVDILDCLNEHGYSVSTCLLACRDVPEAFDLSDISCAGVKREEWGAWVALTQVLEGIHKLGDEGFGNCSA